MPHCLVMFSGGLDSTIAVHILKSQGLDVKALHFVLPFYSNLNRSHQSIKDSAAALGVPLRIEEEGDDFLPLIRHPKFGYGKNANPCVDCRIHRLCKARRIMDEEGAQFLVTGEVVGQRPMSQRMDSLNKIEREAGLRGLLLRPLSAKLLKPTIAEEQGIVKRELLLGISGRGRKEQMAYAERFGLTYQTPAGGCLLTNEATAVRFEDLRAKDPEFGLLDFKLIAFGRHFRVKPEVKLIVARNDGENDVLEKLASPEETLIYMTEAGGPLSLIRGRPDEEDVLLSARIVARFSQARALPTAKVTIVKDAETRVVEIVPATDEECGTYRICGVVH